MYPSLGACTVLVCGFSWKRKLWWSIGIEVDLSARSDSLVFIQDSQVPDVSNCILRSVEHASGNNWLLNSRRNCVQGRI